MKPRVFGLSYYCFTPIYWASLTILLLSVILCQAQWVAFNDHASSTSTHSNATSWNVFGTTSGAPGNAGFLKNIANGTNLPVTLTIVNNGAHTASAASSPAAGSPAYNTFNGFVDFVGSPNPSVEVTNSESVTYRLSGLNPEKRYYFAGTAVRGGTGYENRWSLFELNGAGSFVSAHTANAYTAGLSGNQVAINTGVNNTAATGDMAVWNNINPGSDGIIEIVSYQYTGAIPGGGTANGAKGYALTGFKLEELSPSNAPVSIAQEPSDLTVTEGDTVLLQVGALGYPLFFQWFKDGAPLSGATNSSYAIASAALTNAGTYFAIVSNQNNTVTSRVATLTVQKDPIVRMIQLTNTWKYDCSGSDLGTEWIASDYNDSGWSNGAALLYNETASIPGTKNTLLPLTNAAGASIITYYFRTHFTWTNDATAYYLVSSNLIDDGMIAYLNGHEVFRFNMSNGPVSASTLSISNVTDASFVLINFSTENLIAEDNVLAVEVHQGSLNSSDVVFGLALNAVPMQGPPVLLKTPEARQATAGERVVLEIPAAGQLPLYYQWQFNGNDLPGMTNESLVIPNAWMGNDGFYKVRVTNALGSIVSLPFRVSVRSPGVFPYYTNNFEGSIGSEWSSSSTALTPVGGRRYLGQFGLDNQTVSLTLNDLPPHCQVSVVCDLFTILTWDGTRGNDTWGINVENGPVLLNSIFQVHHSYTTQPFPFQSFPDPTSNPIFPVYTGAAEVETLGYFYNSHAEDAVYHMVYTCPHTNNSVRLNFTSHLDEGLGNEAWGLDNVEIYLWSNPRLTLQQSGGNWVVAVDGVPGTQVSIKSSKDVAAPDETWITVTNILLPGFIQQELGAPRRFYKAVTQ